MGGETTVQFRYQALQRKREPDELDAPVLLAAPRGWIAVFVVMIVMAGACVWAAFARLDVTVDAPGVLSHPAGTSQVQSPYTGMARELLVRPAQEVSAGQPVARLTDDAGRVRTVTSPFAGKVISATMTSGQLVRVGATLATVERTDLPGDRLVALVFVPADQAARLAPGRPVSLSVSTAPPAAYGLLRGKVARIDPYPLTKEALASLVGGDLAADGYHRGQAPRLVTVDLIRDRESASGYTWSTTHTPPVALASQTSVTASIELRTQSPFDLVLGR
ncbi:HlyD family efflux transporter periplasmic adaptor subunit [Streptomyces sp. NBC_00237]|uniref:HlyD family efflux transporter periplasmic adaptor subunit n=1 Tax=Streptomyces sp. NBC_00237 TaxID=2975687 RepID=UPI0022598615|nr:HlyD family efflux transporter periplasmic adaptor subunit [Streptomyces sp. NBC_00237]MCX5203658.1 HlyD family efflux transporter periplasmic adaptor subunit [Streptomyces sp. NBC_00237]